MRPRRAKRRARGHSLVDARHRGKAVVCDKWPAAYLRRRTHIVDSAQTAIGATNDCPVPSVSACMSLPIDHVRRPKPGDLFAEKYRLECILGSGGMGVVFGATHLITHKRVAIKWLAGDAAGGTLSDITQRFVREARLAGEFQHPNVVQVYDLGESDGSFYMVMEWLEGESLAARLERVGRLSFLEASACLVPCMHAMQRAHDVGIIHRDIKPANIFLCDATEDRPALSKVLDFGISKRVTAGVDMGTFVTKTGMLVGTPHYLAPEQLRARPVDRRTDVYGFGVLLYQTLAGVLPFAADNFGDLVVEISVGTPRSLREHVPDLPVGVEQVVMRAMAREPEHRYPNLHELIASLQALDPAPLTAATLPQIATPPTLRPISTTSRRPEGRRSSSRERTLVAVATAASMLAAAVGFAMLMLDQRGNDEPGALVRPRELAQPDDPREQPPAELHPGAIVLDPMPAADGGYPLGSAIDVQEATAAPALLTESPAGVSAKKTEPKPSVPAKPAEPAKPPAQHSVKTTEPPAAAPQAAPLAPQTPSPKPSQPAAPPQDMPAADEVREPEHNPLHMSIQ